MAQKTRSELQLLFQTGAKPSQQDFYDFIESTLNRKDDGIENPAGVNNPLRITAQDEDEKLLDFYSSDGAINTWNISQKSEDKEGLNISNSSGDSQLFIDSSSGNVGIGTDEPGAKLHINGTTTTNSLSVTGDSNLSGKLTVKDEDLVFKINESNDQNQGILFRNTGGAYQWRIYRGVNNETPVLKVAGGAANNNFNDLQDLITITDEGNVGIGTDYPGAKLHINGTTITNQLAINRVEAADDHDEDTHKLKIYGGDLVLRVNENEDKQSIFFQNSGGAYTWRIYRSNVGNNHADLKIDGGASANIDDLNNAVTISDDLNVGIGTDTPGAKLSINGGLHIGGDSDPGDENLLVDGTTTTNSLSVTSDSNLSGKLTVYNEDLVFRVEDNNEQNQGILFQNYGLAYQWRIYRGVNNGTPVLKFAGGAANNDFNNLQDLITITNQGKVGIGTDEPTSKLEVNGTIKAKRLQVTDTKPIKVEKFTGISGNSHKNTGYSTTDWICGIIGFHSGSGDIQEDNSGDIIKVYAYPHTNGNWYIYSDFRSHNRNESWTIWLMAIRTDIVEAVNNLAY